MKTIDQTSLNRLECTIGAALVKAGEAEPFIHDIVTDPLLAEVVNKVLEIFGYANPTQEKRP